MQSLHITKYESCVADIKDSADRGDYSRLADSHTTCWRRLSSCTSRFFI